MDRSVFFFCFFFEEQLEAQDDAMSSDEEDADEESCSDFPQTTAPADTDQQSVSLKDQGRKI